MRVKKHLMQVETLKLTADEKEQVLLFLDHLSENAITPSAAGYFDFNRRMLMSVSSLCCYFCGVQSSLFIVDASIRQILGAVLTYLIVMIQFKLQRISDGTQG